MNLIRRRLSAVLPGDGIALRHPELAGFVPEALLALPIELVTKFS